MSSYRVHRVAYIPRVDRRRSSLTLCYGLASLAVSAPAGAQEARRPPDEWLGPDKPVHAFAAGWVTGAGYAAGIELDWDPDDRRRGAIACGVAASLAKEAYDRWTGRGPFSFKDLVADAVGIAAFVALSASLDR